MGFLAAAVAFACYITAAAPLVIGFTRVVRLSIESYRLINNLVPVLCFALALLTAWAIDRAWKKLPKASTPIALPIVSAHLHTTDDRPESRTATQPRQSRRWIGYTVAVLGLVGFITTIAAAVALKIEGVTARYVAQGSFLFMGLAFWLGTIIVAVEKGYHLFIGVLLGAFSPLGLLILTLMPDLAGRNAALHESQRAAQQIPRMPEYPGA